MTKELTKRTIVVQEPTLALYTKKVIELTGNGFTFESGRPIGAFLYADFTRMEEVEVVIDVSKDATENESKGETTETLTQGPVGVTGEDGPDGPKGLMGPSLSMGVEAILEHANRYEDKDTLEAYGLELGFDLNKRKSLANMVKELKKLIEA